MFTRNRTTALAAVVTAGALGLAACGSSGGSGQSSEKVLKVWWYEAADSAMGIAWNQALGVFKKQHPGVKVEFQLKTFNQIEQSASMILNSGSAPDVMESNKGNATAGLFSKEGLLTDLTPEVTRYGWAGKLPPNVKEVSRYNNGVMGSGDYYGIPDYSEYLMVYYNKNLFQRYHVQVPTTFAQFQAALQTFKSHGVTPLANAGNDYAAGQYLYQLALSKATPSWVDSYQRYTSPANFHDAQWTYAATTLQNWVKAGYIAKSSVSETATQMGNDFEAGKYPMMLSGSWWYGALENEIKNFQWGTFLWPGSQIDPGSGGNLWVVPSGAKDKSLAYDFINDTLRPAIQDTLANKGAVPVNAKPSQVTGEKAKTLISDYNTLIGRDGLGFYPDWPTPSFYNTVLAETQDLMNGTRPDTVLTALQNAYDQGAPSH
jgi:raffinose/stachyose/melibiose transport system substrate-binding protein